jgi:hypothetical protein
MSGEWTHQPPPEVSTEAFAERMAQRAACSEARLSLAARPACGAELMIAGGSAAACAVNESRLGCAEYHACLDRSGSSALLSTPLECIGVDLSSPILSTGFTPEALMTPQANASAPFPLFVPLVALWHGATRLASGGAGALVMAGLQIAFGLAAFLLVTSGMSKANEPGFGSALANITLGPLAVIALGSVLALVLQLIMLAALYGLSWVTGFAAWAAGATGIAGGCWWCFTKVAEKGVEHSVSR